jgi:hypothetical protein
MTISATIDDADPATAEIVTVAVRGVHNTGGMTGLGVDFGDQRPRGVAGPFHLDGPPNMCEGADKWPPTHEERSLSYAYRVPGRFRVTVIALTDNCHGSERAEAVGIVTVHPGSRPTNGPLRPEFGSQTGQDLCAGGSACAPPGDRDSALVYLNLEASDDDGYISQLAIDWNDGSAKTTFMPPLRDCQDPQGYWPSSSFGTRAQHRYSKPGEYHVGLSVRSVGCTGKDAQFATTVVRVKWPWKR